MLLEMTTTFVGPARVVFSEGARVRIALPDETVWAEMAMPVMYSPNPGDIVLAIGHESAWYVIGVLAGTGVTLISSPGPLQLRALGSIDLVATREVAIRAPEVRLHTGKLEILATRVVERFTNVCRTVRETLQLRAGRVHSRVSGEYRLRADRIVGVADREVKLDGRRINLG